MVMCCFPLHMLQWPPLENKKEARHGINHYVWPINKKKTANSLNGNLQRLLANSVPRFCMPQLFTVHIIVCLYISPKFPIVQSVWYQSLFCRAECGPANRGCWCTQCWKHKGMDMTPLVWCSFEFLTIFLLLLSFLPRSYLFLFLFLLLGFGRNFTYWGIQSESCNWVPAQELWVKQSIFAHLTFCMYVCVRACAWEWVDTVKGIFNLF